MKTYGIIGYPLTHSFSPRYFADKFHRLGITNHRYIIGEMSDLKELDAWIQKEKVLGFNVTIPYKRQILPFLDFIQPAALLIKAVNCVKVIWKTTTDYEMVGLNTDILGFSQSLQPLLKSNHTQALILGTGGAAAAVAYVLRQLNISFLYVSRNPQNSDEVSYANLSKELIWQNTLIINTTPAGMYPKVNTAPEIPYQFLTNRHLLFDLIYNPEETLFLKQGAKRGACIKNGYEMLTLQAEASWDFWND